MMAMKDTRPILARLEEAARSNVEPRVRENLCMEAKGVIEDLVDVAEASLRNVESQLHMLPLKHDPLERRLLETWAERLRAAIGKAGGKTA